MMRRVAAVVLTAVMLGSCAANPELKVLQDETFADLSRTSVGDSVDEVFRHETEAGTTLGKPVYAGITVTYTVTGEPGVTFEEIKDLAAADGWTLKQPVFGDTLTGHKQLNDLVGDLHLTFVPPGRDTTTGEPGPAVITSLTARPT